MTRLPVRASWHDVWEKRGEDRHGAEECRPVTLRALQCPRCEQGSRARKSGVAARGTGPVISFLGLLWLGTFAETPSLFETDRVRRRPLGGICVVSLVNLAMMARRAQPNRVDVASLWTAVHTNPLHRGVVDATTGLKQMLLLGPVSSAPPLRHSKVVPHGPFVMRSSHIHASQTERN